MKPPPSPPNQGQFIALVSAGFRQAETGKSKSKIFAKNKAWTWPQFPQMKREGKGDGFSFRQLTEIM